MPLPPTSAATGTSRLASPPSPSPSPLQSLSSLRLPSTRPIAPLLPLPLLLLLPAHLLRLLLFPPLPAAPPAGWAAPWGPSWVPAACAPGGGWRAAPPPGRSFAPPQPLPRLVVSRSVLIWVLFFSLKGKSHGIFYPPFS